MYKTLLLLALAALPIGAESESRVPVRVGEGKSHASCTDRHGVTHHADCTAPYRAYCREPEPGECQCGCVYPLY
jgi:hypothetical protein